MPLDNCKRCKRLYQRNLGNLCPECLTQEQTLTMEIYRYAQEHPGASAESIAEHFHLMPKEVESLVHSGALGPANQLISTHCARCKCEMTLVKRVGYFCYECNKFVEKQAGRVSQSEKRIDNILQGRSALDKEKQSIETRHRGNYTQNTAPTKHTNKYGFKRSK